VPWRLLHRNSPSWKIGWTLYPRACGTSFKDYEHEATHWSLRPMLCSLQPMWLMPWHSAASLLLIRRRKLYGGSSSSFKTSKLPLKLMGSNTYSWEILCKSARLPTVWIRPNGGNQWETSFQSRWSRLNSLTSVLPGFEKEFRPRFGGHQSCITSFQECPVNLVIELQA